MDAGRRARARRDKDFSDPGIQSQLALRFLLVDDPGNSKQLTQALAGTVYHLGSFNYTSKLTLAHGGSATWQGSRPDPDFKGDGFPAPIAFDERGTWKVEGARLRLGNLGSGSGLYQVSVGGLMRVPAKGDKPGRGQADRFDFPSPSGEGCGH